MGEKMEKKTEPLLFINTVSTPIENKNAQLKYDSRTPLKKEVVKVVLNPELLEKIDGLISSIGNNQKWLFPLFRLDTFYILFFKFIYFFF